MERALGRHELLLDCDGDPSVEPQYALLLVAARPQHLDHLLQLLLEEQVEQVQRPPEQPVLVAAHQLLARPLCLRDDEWRPVERTVHAPR